MAPPPPPLLPAYSPSLSLSPLELAAGEGD